MAPQRATALLTRPNPVPDRHPAPEPLFEPGEVGLDADSWDDLRVDVPRVDVPRCEGKGGRCKRPLTSKVSQEAGIGPCCAAEIGRAVHLNMKKARAARKARTPGQRAASGRRRAPRKREKARA